MAESHPDFKEISEQDDVSIVSASLVDLCKFSLFDNENEQIDSIVHHITFNEGVTLSKLFRRVEKSVFSGKERVIPSLEFKENGEVKYIFCFKDRAFLTFNRRFYREEWLDDD